MSEIVRPQTIAERKDFQVAGINDYQKLWRKRLAKAETDFLKKKTYTPFDRNCAIFDFKDQEKALVDEQIRSTESFNPAVMEKFVIDFNFEKYEDAGRWDVIGDSPIRDKVMVGGVPHSSHTSQAVEYRHKQYVTLHQSIQVPLEIFNEKFKGKKKVEDKKEKPEEKAEAPSIQSVVKE